jgi:4,5-DOPA dioxygenase extradiol
MGSGNLVHNLQAYVWDSPELGSYDWALRFERKARRIIESGNDTELVDYREMGPDARLAIPTPDHYLPLLYVLGARREGDSAAWPVEGFDGGSMSMLAVQLG